MGKSFNVAATETFSRLMKQFSHGPSTNTYSTDGGKTVYFTEEPKETRDGGMRGEVMKMVQGGAIDSGSYHIAGNGQVLTFSGIPSAFWNAKTTPKARRAPVYAFPIILALLLMFHPAANAAKPLQITATTAVVSATTAKGQLVYLVRKGKGNWKAIQPDGSAADLSQAGIIGDSIAAQVDLLNATTATAAVPVFARYGSNAWTYTVIHEAAPSRSR